MTPRSPCSRATKRVSIQSLLNDDEPCAASVAPAANLSAAVLDKLHAIDLRYQNDSAPGPYHNSLACLHLLADAALALGRLPEQSQSESSLAASEVTDAASILMGLSNGIHSAHASPATEGAVSGNASDDTISMDFDDDATEIAMEDAAEIATEVAAQAVAETAPVVTAPVGGPVLSSRDLRAARRAKQIYQAPARPVKPSKAVKNGKDGNGGNKVKDGKVRKNVKFIKFINSKVAKPSRKSDM